MTQLDIKHQTVQKLEALSKQSHKSVDEILDWFLSNYGAVLVAEEASITDDESTWTDEELAAVMQNLTPLTGKEMVEGGFVGGWEHKDIDDSVAFLEQQRTNRKRNKFA